MAIRLLKSLLLAAFSLTSLVTLPTQALDGLPIIRSVDSSVLSQAPRTLTFYLYDEKDALDPFMVQSVNQDQWQADVDLNIWPLAQHSMIRFQTQLNGLAGFAQDSTLWIEMEIDGVLVGERSLLTAGAAGISAEGLIESRSLTEGGFKFPDGSVQTTAATDTNSGGTVTAITAGTGLTGGTITSSGTISVPAGGILNSMITGPIDESKIDADITRDSELAAKLATKADISHDHDGRYYSKSHVDALEQRIANLESLLSHFTRVDDEIYITGANLNIRNGQGSTQTLNGLGNLIVGYNERRISGDPSCSHGTYIEETVCINNGGTWAVSHKSGSHNAVIGLDHNYSHTAGLVVGRRNTISGLAASVSGGYGNTASRTGSSVSGGSYNSARGSDSSVSGGNRNTAIAGYSSISGGTSNTTSASYSSISGGYSNETTSGFYSSVNGGNNNTASGKYSTVSGGNDRSTTGYYDWAAGSLAEDF